MASLTAIIQSRVIPNSYERLPVWLRWLLCVPITGALAVAALVLMNIVFSLFFLDIQAGRLNVYDSIYREVFKTATQLVKFYIVSAVIFRCLYYFAPDHKQPTLQVALTFSLALVFWQVIDTTLKLLNPTDHPGVIVPTFWIDAVLQATIYGVFAFQIGVLVYLYRKLTGPRQRLVDIGTNLNRKGDV